MKPKRKKKRLYEVIIKSAKGFYIYAESEEDALKSDIVEDESHVYCNGEIEWEHDETEARPVTPDFAKFIERKHPEQILK